MLKTEALCVLLLFFDLLCLTGSIVKASEERLSREEIFNKMLVLMVSANRAEVGSLKLAATLYAVERNC